MAQQAKQYEMPMMYIRRLIVHLVAAACIQHDHMGCCSQIPMCLHASCKVPRHMGQRTHICTFHYMFVAYSKCVSVHVDVDGMQVKSPLVDLKMLRCHL